MLIDAMAHLDDPRVPAIAPLLERAKRADIEFIVSAGTNPLSDHQAKPLPVSEPQIFRAFGIHPSQVDEASLRAQLESLSQLLKQDKVVAIGECGLDRRDGMPPIDTQLTAFKSQLKLSDDLQLPFILHSVRATGMTMSELKKHGPFKQGGLWHGFTGPADIIDQLVALNMSISVGALVTQPRATKCRQAAAQVPLNALLIESDCPDHPTPKSTTGIGEPSQLWEIIEELATLRSESPEELASATRMNAKRLYGLP